MTGAFEETWEGWLRPVLLIALAGGVALAWWLKVLPDDALATLIIAVAFGGFALVVAEQALRSRLPGWRRAVALGVAAASCVVAAVVPWAVLGADSVVARAALERGAALEIPPTGAGVTPCALHIHAEPTLGRTTAKLEVRLEPAGGTPQLFQADFETPRLGRDGRTRGEARHDMVRHLEADLTRGGTLRVTADREGDVARPLEVRLRREPPPVWVLVLVGAPLVLLGALLDATSPLRRPSRVAGLAATAGAFGVAFRHLVTPAATAQAALFGVTVAAAAGVFGAWVLTSLLRRLLRRPADAGAADAGPAAEA